MVDVVGKFGSLVRGQRTPIEMVLLALILINWAPTAVLGSTLNSQLNSMLGPVMNPIKTIMGNIYIRFFLWLVLVWSCCLAKDMKLFFLISIYFLSSR
jgi:hypothetical protein